MKRNWGRIGFVAVLVSVAIAGAAVAALVARAATATTRVKVTERDYRVVLAKHTFAPGRVTFVVTNRGKVIHEFAVHGPGLSKRIPGVLKPGKTKSLTVTLHSGTYTLECPLHVGMGMKTTIHVTGGGGTTQTTTNGTTTGSTTGWAG